MSNLNYDPKPLDTSQFKLTDDILRLTELLAENTHDVWARERITNGWVFGPRRDDELKQHPCLVPYKDLPESEKQYDRNAALETIKTVLSLGYPRPIAAGRLDDSIFTQGVDPEEKGRAIIAALKKPKLSLNELRYIWEERLPLVWFRKVEIYRRAVDAALKLGEAFLAFDIAVEGLNTFKGDLRLVQLQALALARTGATRRANEILAQLRTSGHQDEETLGILARTHKDFWLLAGEPDQRKHHLKLSFELYAEAYRRNRGYYSGINAASMGLIYGVKDVAHHLAAEVFDKCQTMLETLDDESEERYWLEATLAEASLILGNHPMAEHYYRHATDYCNQSTVVLSRTRSQARLLLEHVCGNPKEMDHCFRLPRIVVFSGHMYDQLHRATPRFPQYLEEPVREEIRQRLAVLEAQVGYSSLACGSDLLFAEALLERGGELNVVLPFGVEDFRACSIDIVPGTDWGQRFDRILRSSASVTILNETGTGNDGAAFEYCNEAINGMGLLKGQFLGMDVMPMAVWDGALGGRGGTQSFVEFWQKQQIPVEIVPLNDILERTPKPETPPATASPNGVPAVAATAANPDDASLTQDIKAMLFADIVGFTKLTERQVPAFVAKFLGKVAELMQQMPDPPIHKNTWGDAVCCVFNKVGDAGVFALNLRDLVCDADWTQFGLPPELSIRIALHAGPVFECYDPVLNKMTYNGSHVNRTARIEPVAEEGQIYASQAFAALATAERVQEFVCDYVGTKQLAKRFGAIPVFLVRRRV